MRTSATIRCSIGARRTGVPVLATVKGEIRMVRSPHAQTEQNAVRGNVTRMTAHVQLMFQDGRAREAVEWYASIVPDARLGESGDATTRFSIGEQQFVAFESPVQHAFGFTAATSICVEVATPDAVDALFNALADGGETLMPLGDYGFSDRFGWCLDRFGVSWQVSTPHRFVS
jgi:predicted 3-demethylubiquinone-9 3-methyltransferase (glyoxalase superfamily)